MSALPRPAGYDADRVWRDFPILRREVHGKPLVFLDSAASSQRPASVVAAVERYETFHHANVHRGVYALSQEATDLFEKARERVRGFVNAASSREVVFTRGTTESINLVAHSWGRANLKPGDEILLTALEHHANIVPWQLVAGQTGAVIKVAPMDRRGVVTLDAFGAQLSGRTKIVACAHVSNALGTVLPVAEMVQLAHARGAVVLVDGAQAVPHQRVDVRALGCDFYAFSAHKMYGPTGTGVLVGRERLFEAMPPWQGGGDMILMVTFERTTYAPAPQKFEAGTPAIVEAIGLGVACDYVASVGLDAIHAHEARLVATTREALRGMNDVAVFGPEDSAGIVSFAIRGVHPHDLGTILDEEDVAIRAGHHCAQPLMEHLGVDATARASFGLYSDEDDIAALLRGIERTKRIFG